MFDKTERDKKMVKGLKIFGALKDVVLFVETNLSTSAKFRKEYIKKTGVSCLFDNSVKIQENKWSTEYRIFFSAEDWVIESLKMLGYSIKKGQNKLHFRIDSERLFWHLVEYGYRLGHNQKVKQEETATAV